VDAIREIKPDFKIDVAAPKIEPKIEVNVPEMKPEIVIHQPLNISTPKPKVHIDNRLEMPKRKTIKKVKRDKKGEITSIETEET